MKTTKPKDKKRVIDVIIPYANIDVIEMNENEVVSVKTISGKTYWVGNGVEHMIELKEILSNEGTNWLRLYA
jgi:hypothetical protein